MATGELVTSAIAHTSQGGLVFWLCGFRFCFGGFVQLLDPDSCFFGCVPSGTVRAPPPFPIPAPCIATLVPQTHVMVDPLSVPGRGRQQHARYMEDAVHGSLLLATQKWLRIWIFFTAARARVIIPTRCVGSLATALGSPRRCHASMRCPAFKICTARCGGGRARREPEAPKSQEATQ